MKKITILALALVAISFASCKKEYTCACTTTISYSGGNDLYKDDAQPYSKKMSKKTAEAACDEKQTAIDASYKNAFTDNGVDQNPGISAKTACELKD